MGGASSSSALWNSGKNERMKPIFRWAGSKRQISARLIPHFPRKFNRYIEPFCGSASLFFLTSPQSSIISDINPELINAYKTIRTSSKRVANIVEGMIDDREFYNSIRSISPTELGQIERAARFVYLNKLCFNGLYRTNRAGAFNVPYSGSRTSSLYVAEELKEASQILSRSQILCEDYGSIIKLAKADDFIYLDPPYASSEGGFCEYSSNPFKTSNLDHLFEQLKEISKRKVKFMLSYADCPEIHRFKTFGTSAYISVRRNIAGFAGNRKNANEVIIKNYQEA